MLYVFSVLTTPEEFIKQLNTIIYSCLWKGTDKIARLAAVNDLEYGGLNLIDLETYVKSSRLAWLEFFRRFVPMESLYYLFPCRFWWGFSI